MLTKIINSIEQELKDINEIEMERVNYEHKFDIVEFVKKHDNYDIGENIEDYIMFDLALEIISNEEECDVYFSILPKIKAFFMDNEYDTEVIQLYSKSNVPVRDAWKAIKEASEFFKYGKDIQEYFKTKYSLYVEVFDRIILD